MNQMIDDCCSDLYYRRSKILKRKNELNKNNITYYKIILSLKIKAPKALLSRGYLMKIHNFNLGLNLCKS